MIKRQLLASCSSFLGSVSSGMVTAFASTLLPQIHQYVDTEMGSWLTSAILFSRIVGIFTGSLLTKKYGRRPFLIFLNIPLILGWICLSAAKDFFVFLIGCLIVGSVAGFYGFIATVYLVEISEPRFRGLFMVICSTSYMSGILLQNVIGTLFEWQTALHVSALWPLLTFFVAFYAPETPNWLILNHYPEQAKENLYWLRNVDDDEDEEFADLLSSSFVRTKNSNETTSTYMLSHVLSRQFFHSLFIVSVLMASVVFSGFEVLTMYSVDMISKMSKELNAQWATILTNVFAVISSMISGCIIERMSRRFIFFLSSFGVLLSLLAIILVLTCHLPKVLLITFLCMYQVMINVGVLTIPWLLAAEIFPDVTRDLGSALGNIFLFALTIMTVKMNPFLLETLGIQMLLFMYANLLLPCILILYFIMPETKGHTLQQIEKRLLKQSI